MISSGPAGALPVELLLAAYANGLFPMAHDDGALYWHDPDPRAVFDIHLVAPDERTSRVIRQGRYSTTMDRNFGDVIRNCAAREETWIDQRIILGFEELHRAGRAHSVEVWEDTRLAGGIYGVAIGGAFFGESMFGYDNAGKVAFHALVRHLRVKGFSLFDTQYINDFTARLGAREIPQVEFKRELNNAIALPVSF